jgi:four helix bundle protein
VEVEQRQHQYDLEERTFQFARAVRCFMKRVPRTMSNYEGGKQLIRSSGSVGANYIEANEALGDKDLLLHGKISRKESKESRYWLRLLDLETKPDLEPDRCQLMQEADELMRIFGAIIRKRS